MSAERLLEELASRDWLSEKVLVRVRQKVSGRGVDADSVARFLVDKGHLTEEQSEELLDAVRVPPMVQPIEEEVAEEEAPDSLDDPTFGATEEDVDDTEDVDSESAKKTRRREKRRKQRKKNQNEWDSPLMLIGGGALLLLLMCGAGVYFLLLRGSGDDLFRVAQGFFDEGSYSQAITQYEQFLEDFPSHEQKDSARVHLGLARIRQALEVSNNFEIALERSSEEIPEMIRTEEVEYAQSDLSALLPRIASGLVAKADSATALDEINKYVTLTNEALDLNLNNKYVPSQKRNKPELEQVQEILSRIEQRRIALEALKQTLDAMQAAVDSGDVRPAYEAHAALVKEHPELSSKPELTDAIAAAVVAEQGGVRFVEAPIDAETSEPESAIAAIAATVNERRAGSAPAEGFAVFQFQGVAYGFSASDGRLLWRRSVGDGLGGVTPVANETACFLVDTRRREIVCVDAASGELRWRVAIDDDLSQPVLLDDRLIAPSKTGRLHVIDTESGRREGYLQFAQPLPTAPVVSLQDGRVYLVGEHSSVYTLSADDLSCLGVFYLGHAKASVSAPPATLLGRVLVAENDGLETSKLHVLTLNDQRVIENKTDSVRFDGLMSRAPVVFGRRLAVVTDTGQIRVFETSPEDLTAPLTELAARRPALRSPTPHFAALVGRHFWVAGWELAKYSIAPAGNRLPKSEVRDPFRDDVFASPLLVRGKVLVHARRRRGNPGLTVGATNPETGEAYWETEVAVPPAGAPSASTTRPTLIHTSATGGVYQVPASTRRSIVVSELEAQPPAGVFVRETATTNTGASLLSTPGSDWVLRVGSESEAVWLQLPDRLACRPTPFVDGWIAPLRVGQVHFLNANSGATPAVPFQPEIRAGEPRRWRPAGAGEVRGEPMAIVTSGDELYGLKLFDGDPPRLEVISAIALDHPFTTQVAIAAEMAVAGRADGSLAIHDAESLEPLTETNPGETIVWGPFAAGGRVVVATTANELICFDLVGEEVAGAAKPLEPVWKVSLPVDGLLGPPLQRPSSLFIATRAGRLHKVQLEDGAINSQNLDEAIATNPITVGDRLALATADGSVLIVDEAR